MSARRNLLPADVQLRLGELPNMIRAERARRGMSQRAVAAQTGVSFNTIARVELGALPDVVNFLAILSWLGVPPNWFTAAGEQDAYRRGWDDCAAAVQNAIAGVPRPVREAA